MQDWYDRGTHGDRFVFALLMAVVLHAALILGVGFSAQDRSPPATSLDITLAPFRSDTAPEEADFLAPTHQLGGGTEARAAEASSPVASNFNAAVVRSVQHEAGGTPGASPAPDDAIRSLANPEQAVAPSDPEARPAKAPGEATAPGATELSSLIARLREQSRAYARRPRIERMTSVSARASEDADYLLGWTERIETVGNINYPEEARRRRLYGDLRLLVAVRPDGSVAEVRVLQSSGQAVLDAAAVRIVHMAAPFEAFSGPMRARSDLLEIIRTWRFRADRLRTAE
jgi:protein TonB